jgi:hypothetical protein
METLLVVARERGVKTPRCAPGAVFTTLGGKKGQKPISSSPQPHSTSLPRRQVRPNRDTFHLSLMLDPILGWQPR